MNWLKKIWRGFREPLPSYPAPKVTPSADARIVPINPTAEDESLSNFTPRAQQVLALSRKEADRFHHNFVGTEHLLLGLIALGQGVAVNVLQKMGLDLETVRIEVESQVGTGPDQKVIGNIPYTPRVKKVLALANKERRALSHTYLGTEHILLGLLREGDGVAARVLRNLEVDIEMTRQEILKELDPNFTLDNSQAETAKADKPGVSVAGSEVEGIDCTRRYDVYCSERQDVMVVYRNVLFKGMKKLVREDRDALGYFYELEQADGSTLFVARYSVVKFCLPGTTLSGENISGQRP
jgi:hypothetical protein